MTVIIGLALVIIGTLASTYQSYQTWGAGAATGAFFGVGLAASILLLVPLIGFLLGPVLTVVAFQYGRSVKMRRIASGEDEE